MKTDDFTLNMTKIINLSISINDNKIGMTQQLKIVNRLFV